MFRALNGAEGPCRLPMSSRNSWLRNIGFSTRFVEIAALGIQVPPIDAGNVVETIYGGRRENWALNRVSYRLRRKPESISRKKYDFSNVLLTDQCHEHPFQSHTKPCVRGHTIIEDLQIEIE